MSRVINNYFDGLQVTSRHKSIYFVIMFAYFFEQFDNWNFGYVVPSIMQAMHLDMSAIGTITFWYFIGMMTGSIIGCILADMLGRKNAFQLGVLIFSGSSVVCGFADNIHLLTVARAMTGFGVMCVNMSAIPYLTEISPAEARGKWQNLTAAVGMIGVPVVGVLCRIVLPLSTDAWRWVFYAGGAGVLLFFGAHRVLLESPRWLMARDRRAEAESVVREISGVDVELSQVKLEKGGVKPPLSEMLLGLFSREYIRTSLVVILPFLILGPATYIFQNWTTTLFKSQGFSLEDSLTITLFMQLGIPVGLFAFSYLSELGGRKLPIVISLFFMGFSGLAITFCTTLWEFCFVGFLIMGCIQGVVYTYLAYTSESFPTKIRNTGLAVLQAGCRITTSLSQLVIPGLYAAFGFSGIFNTFFLLCIIPAVFIALFAKRTAGRPLEEI